MTSQKQLKSRIRERMARTGERYTVARARVLGPDGRHPHPDDRENAPAENAPAVEAPAEEAPAVDHGYLLTGGTDPDAAALTHLLTHAGVRGPDGPLSEPLLFAVSGGLGAGYILWEFAHDDSRHVTLGFSHSWNYLGRRLEAALARLGLDADWHRTGGSAGAGKRLRAELGEGRPCVVWPDRYSLGYWHVPELLDGHGGHPVVAYAAAAGRVHLDDRTLAPLTVAADALDAARARVGSYRNALLVLGSHEVAVPTQRLRAAVRDGLAATVDYLGGTSSSFALPAWRKWARLLTDERNTKGWPVVFADGRALPGALLSVWEGIEPAGMTGGNLRPLFADALSEAAEVLDEPALAAEADAWRSIAELWHELAETAVPAGDPVTARLRQLTASVSAGVVEGDAGADDRAAAAAELWRLRAEHDSGLLGEGSPGERFAAMSAVLREIYSAERSALDRLGGLLSE